MSECEWFIQAAEKHREIAKYYTVVKVKIERQKMEHFHNKTFKSDAMNTLDIHIKKVTRCIIS